MARIAGIVVLTAISLASLAGCSAANNVTKTGGSLVDKTLIDSGLRDLKKDLAGMQGVESINTSAELQPDFSYNIAAHVLARSLSEKQELAIVQRVASTFGSGSFAKQHRFLDLTTAHGVSVEVSIFNLSSAQLRSELAYAFSAESAAGGSVTLGLDASDPSTDGGAPYKRSLSVASPAASIGWDALRSIVDDSSALTSWSFPGLSATGSLPPKDVTELLREVTVVVAPLNSSGPLPDDFVSLDWYGEGAILLEAIQSKGFTHDLAASQTPAWPRVLSALALTTKLSSAAAFSYSGSDGRDGTSGTIFFGTCAGTVVAGPRDEALYSQVVAAGIALPNGSGAGFCQLQ